MRWRIYVAWLGVPTLVAILASIQPWVPPSVLFKDTLTVAEAHEQVHFGLVSNLGILIWCCTAAVCLFVATLLRENREPARFLRAAGAVSLLLLFDDMFLAHEVIFPKLGVPELLIYVAYGTVTLLYLVRFRHSILKADYGILVLGLALLGSSVVVDQVLDSSELKSVIEDAPKLVGAAAWAAFHIRAARGLLTG